jgi:hypothetical protein
MTNDQFPMTNGGGRATRGVQGHPRNGIRNWPLGFGHCPGLFAKVFANNPG